MADPIQGFLATLTLDAVDITLFVTDFSFPRTRTILDKSVQDSSGQSASIPGKESGTLSINGLVDQANQNALELSWAKTVPVSFVFGPTEGLTTDFTYTGLVTLGDITLDVAGDSNWAFSLSGETSGATVFVPSAP